MQILKQKPVLGSLLDYGNPLTKGLIGCWLMNEGAGNGNKVYDLSGNGNHGTFQNQTYRKVNGLYCDGTDDYVSFDWSKTGIKDYPITLMMIAQKKDYVPVIVAECLFSATDSSVDDNWIGALFSADREFRIIEFGGAGVGIANSPAFSITEGKVHNCVAVFESNSLRRNYLNGILQATDTTATGCDISVIDKLNFAFLERPTAAYYLVDTPEFALFMWNRALTPVEIMQLYQEPYCFISEPIRRRRFYSIPEVAVGGVVQAAAQADIGTSTAAGFRRNRVAAAQADIALTTTGGMRWSMGALANITTATTAGLWRDRPMAGQADIVIATTAGMRRLNIPGAAQADIITRTYAGATGGTGVAALEEIFRNRRFRLSETFNRQRLKGVY